VQQSSNLAAPANNNNNYELVGELIFIFFELKTSRTPLFASSAQADN
jgi:hypothetical protein